MSLGVLVGHQSDSISDKGYFSIKMFLNSSLIMQLVNFLVSMLAKHEAFPRLAPRNSRKRLDIFLKDLGAVQLDNFHDSNGVKPCDLSNHSLGPRQEAAVSYDGL